MKLLIIGLDNAGKTTIIRRFNGEPIDTIAPTLGFDIKTLQHKQYTLNIWDIGASRRHKNLLAQLLRGDRWISVGRRFRG